MKQATICLTAEQLDLLRTRLEELPPSTESDAIIASLIEAKLQLEGARVWAALYDRLERAVALLAAVQIQPDAIVITGTPVLLGRSVPLEWVTWRNLATALLTSPPDYSILARVARLSDDLASANETLRQRNADQTDWKGAYERAEAELVEVHAVLDKLGYQRLPSAARRLTQEASHDDSD